MAFMTEARKVADVAAPLGHRYHALCHCVERFSPLGFQATLEYLATNVGVTDDRWTSAQLSSALDLLMQERSRSVAFNARWAAQRRARKLAGHRVSRDELLERDSMPWLTWPREEIRNRRLTLRSVPIDVFPFRPSQREDYQAVLATMPAATHELHATFDVTVYDDWLRIPYRIYNPPPVSADLIRLSDHHRLMLNCLYSRHHDGHVRQEHIRRLIQADEPWVAPYVVALIGEYVVEIIADIAVGLSDVHTIGSWQARRYGRFARDNPTFIDLTTQRVESYWREYYALDYARPGHDVSGRPEYPGFGLVRALRKAAAERP